MTKNSYKLQLEITRKALKPQRMNLLCFSFSFTTLLCCCLFPTVFHNEKLSKMFNYVVQSTEKNNAEDVNFNYCSTKKETLNVYVKQIREESKKCDK